MKCRVETRGGRGATGGLVAIQGFAFLAICFGGIAPGQAQDTPDYFRQNCLNCHTIGGGPLAGPDLKNVTQRQDREWLIGFMMDPGSYLDRGDPYAKKILEQSRNVRMPALPGLDRERAENLLDLIEAESALPESQFKGLRLSTAPFTEADRQYGRELFLGLASLENGGGACIACHAVRGQPAIGG
ncbi:MAG: cytochrome c, partial [Pirellulales bacterium]|nr:cytochrome c [Pirellulales bacterium]